VTAPPLLKDARLQQRATSSEARVWNSAWKI